MSFKVAIFAVTLFASQINAQRGIVTPFIAGYANGLSEFAKPFIQLGQGIRAPGSEYFPSVRPQIAQWMVFPNRRPLVPQAQAAAMQGYETVAPSVVQIVRPRPFDLQMIPIANPASLLRPFRPYPAPAPAPASEESQDSEESGEIYVPSNLLPEEIPADLSANISTEADVPVTLDPKDVPALQRPLPFVEDEQ